MAKLLPSTHPFEDYTVYGPYEGMKGGSIRRMVALVGERRTTMSYARYLACVKEGRWLEEWEDADHIDDDRMNDDPSNIQVLPRPENLAKRVKGPTMVTLVCPTCNESFTRVKRNTHLVKGGRPTNCSRSCGGKASHTRDGIPSS